MKQKLSIIFFVLLIVLSGCKASVDNDNAYDPEPPASQEPNDPGDGNTGGGPELDLSNQPALQNRKIIYTVDLGIVSTTPTDTYNDIMTSLSSYDAYVESEEITTKLYKVTIRVKSEDLTGLVNAIQDNGETVNYKKTSTDVTNSYSTLQARLEALEAQHARILELIEAAETLDDLLELEEKRVEIEADLNEIGLQLNTYDSLVEYSTINLTISKIGDMSDLLPKTSAPNIYEESTNNDSVTIELNNQNEYPVTMTITVIKDGKTVKELTKDVYQQSRELVTIEGLNPGQLYRIEVVAQGPNHSASIPDMIEIETDNTFVSSISNAFVGSVKVLFELCKILVTVIVAISPFALLLGIVIGIPLRISHVKRKKRKEINPNNKVQ